VQDPRLHRAGKARLASFDSSAEDGDSGSDSGARTSTSHRNVSYSGTVYKRLHVGKWGKRHFELQVGLHSHLASLLLPRLLLPLLLAHTVLVGTEQSAVVCFQGRTLTYYAEAASSAPRKQLKLKGATLYVSTVRPVLGKTRYHMSLRNGQWEHDLKAYLLAEEERAAWVDALQRVGVQLVTERGSYDVDE
jgi:hypothetical protein